MYPEGCSMDNFMDKVAQKLTSQDMIRANAAADAAELQSLETQMELFKEQMGKYDECLQEMRKLNLKNIESAEDVQQLANQANAHLNKTVEESLAKIAEIKENADNVDAITETMTGMQDKLEESFKSMEDFLHTDNVKVYRNVQAAMIEELEKQTAEIKEAQNKVGKSYKVLIPFVIITMIVSLANLGIAIARIFGLF